MYTSNIGLIGLAVMGKTWHSTSREGIYSFGI